MLRQYPELTLRVWARPDGVHVRAALAPPQESFPRSWETVAEAVFQPRQVTEISVVEWGMRALRAWLESQASPDQNPSSSA